MGLSHLTDGELACWVAASCEAQGVPVKVDDPLVVRRVGVLLGADAAGLRERKRSGTRSAAGSGLVAPLHVHPARVQGLGSGAAGADQDVVDEGAHDGDLAGEVQRRPRSA